MVFRTGTVLAPIALVVSLAALAPRSASAQQLVVPAPRQGYYLGGGFSQGLLDLRADSIGSLGIMRSGGVALRFGQMAGQTFGFGLNLRGGGGINDDWSGGLGGLQLETQFVPLDHVAIRGGIGVGGLGVSRKDAEAKTKDDPKGAAGTLYTAGLSYDWFPWWEKGDSSGGLAVTVFMEAIVLPSTDLIAGGLQIGIELTWWTGLPKNRLDLPPDAAFKP